VIWSKKMSLILLALVTFWSAQLNAGEMTTKCQIISIKSLTELASQWRGRELIAFASWCSSCKQKITAARATPEAVVFLSVFEDPKISEAALARLKITAPCIASEDLAAALGVKSLPWSQKI
jgi:hypothetical protein